MANPRHEGFRYHRTKYQITEKGRELLKRRIDCPTTVDIEKSHTNRILTELLDGPKSARHLATVLDTKSQSPLSIACTMIGHLKRGRCVKSVRVGVTVDSLPKPEVAA